MTKRETSVDWDHFEETNIRIELSAEAHWLARRDPDVSQATLRLQIEHLGEKGVNIPCHQIRMQFSDGTPLESVICHLSAKELQWLSEEIQQALKRLPNAN